MATLVIGAGKSGIAAVKFLLSLGEKVVLYDDRRRSDLTHPNLVEIFPQAYEIKEDISQVILSPGVSLKHSLVLEAKNKNIPVINEIDLAYSHLPKSAQFIGITGTNGKSTTTSMVEKILQTAGYKAIACGNFGIPLCELLLEKIFFDYYVVELSSFQLETITKIKLSAAVIVNFSPDHMDRYESVDDYLSAKLNIKKLLLPDKLLFFNNFLIKDFSSLGIKGVHNQENASAAYAISTYLGIENKFIDEALKNFKNLPHRCEIVANKNGVTFINDSKGTNVNAVKMALSMLYGPVHLLLGGIDKEEDFSLLKLDQLKFPVFVYVYGQSKEKIAKDLKNHNPILAHTLDEIFSAAIKNIRCGDQVLLSPGCTSYDQYNNYIERGDHFKRLVECL